MDRLFSPPFNSLNSCASLDIDADIANCCEILEAEKQEQINKASGEAAAMLAVAEARAKGLQLVARSLGIQDGKNAASLSIAEQYVRAFNKLAKTNNTMILPSNPADVPNIVAQVCCIYQINNIRGLEYLKYQN